MPDAIQVSIPERRHELLAQILAEAVLKEGSGRTARDSALEAADRRGQELGADERERRRPGRLGAERALSLAATSLETFGFEPERAAQDLLILRNCPFHPIARESPELVCELNHRFLGGFLRGLGADASTTAVLQPDPEACCVRLCPAQAGASLPE